MAWKSEGQPGDISVGRDGRGEGQPALNVPDPYWVLLWAKPCASDSRSQGVYSPVVIESMEKATVL